MSGTLDRIAAQGNLDTRVTIGGPDGPELPTWVSRDDLRALVNVARAAEHYLNGTDPDGYIRLRDVPAVIEGRA